jgi:hypothetical protein
MMHWKRFLAPAVVALALPLFAAAADAPKDNPTTDKKPTTTDKKTTTGNSCSGGSGCSTCAGGCGANGAVEENCGKHHHCHSFGLLASLFQFLHDTNEAPNFRERGSCFKHFCGGRVGGHIGGGNGADGYNNGYGGMRGGLFNHVGHGFFQPPFQAAPWYLYWPYDSHFQLPAPISAPYYPPQAYGYPGAANPYFGTAPVMAPGGYDPRNPQGYGQPNPGGYGYPAPGNFQPAPSVTPVIPKK